MTTAFLLMVEKTILLLQDNLLFRFKIFVASGQLVKLSSSQTASQGCVPFQKGCVPFPLPPSPRGKIRGHHMMGRGPGPGTAL